MNKLKLPCKHLTIETKTLVNFVYKWWQRILYGDYIYLNEYESNVPLGWDGEKRYNFMQNQLAWNVNNNDLKKRADKLCPGADEF